MTTPPHTPGQLDLTDTERADYAARLEMVEAERARLVGAMVEHTTRALQDVAQAVARHAALGRELDDAVRFARKAGASWEAIGQAAGMSRQAAHSRWSDQ